jgi:hypothetical protein
MAETCCKVKTVKIHSIYTGTVSTEHVIKKGYVFLIFFLIENFNSKKFPLNTRTAQYMLLFSPVLVCICSCLCKTYRASLITFCIFWPMLFQTFPFEISTRFMLVFQMLVALLNKIHNSYVDHSFYRCAIPEGLDKIQFRIRVQ